MNIEEAIRTALEEEEARTQHRMPPLEELLNRGAVHGRRRRATHLAAAGVAAAVGLGAVAVAINRGTEPAPPASGSTSTSAAPAAPATTLPATAAATGDGATGPDYAGSYQERQIMRTLKHEAAWEAEGIKIGRIGVRADGTTPTMAVEVYGDVDRFIEIALQDRNPRVRIIIEPLAKSPTPASGFPLPDLPQTNGSGATS